MSRRSIRNLKLSTNRYGKHGVTAIAANANAIAILSPSIIGAHGRHCRQSFRQQLWLWPKIQSRRPSHNNALGFHSVLFLAKSQ
jgi:hypothetical protein